MTWTATLERISTGRGKVTFSVFYEDLTIPRSTLITYKRSRLDDNELETLTRSEIDRLEDAISDPLTYSPDDPIDVSDPIVIPPDPPTAEEIAELRWLADWRELNQLLLLGDTTVHTDAARITALTTSLTTDFLASYLPNVEW